MERGDFIWKNGQIIWKKSPYKGRVIIISPNDKADRDTKEQIKKLFKNEK